MSYHSLNWARLLMICSGLASLGWQMIWTTQWSLLLGHEVYSVLAISAAFFGGLGLGTWLTTRPIFHFRNSLAIYVTAEIVIAIWGLFLLRYLPSLDFISPLFLGLTPSPLVQSLFAFAFPFILLLPATTAMGVTLPSLFKTLQLTSSDLADLYAFNTLGAMLGVVWVVFVTLPLIGTANSEMILVGINVFCASLASLLWFSNKKRFTAHSFTELRGPLDFRKKKIIRQFFTMFLLGFLGIGYQVIAIRVLSLVTENTVYSYALLLIVYLAFHAAGAALFKFIHLSKHHFKVSDEMAYTLLIASIFAGVLGLTGAENLYLLPGKFFSESMVVALMGEALAATAALAIPSAAMGYLFAHQTTRFENQPGWVGLSLSWNIFGAAFAPIIMGLFVFPVWGVAVSISVILLAYMMMQKFTQIKDGLKLWPICIVIMVLNGNLSWDFLTVPQGGKLLFYEDGLMASVSVTKDIQGIARLQINNRVQEGSSASGWVERRLAILPMMFHHQPEQVLILGLGTGFTAAAAAEYGNVKVQAVELLPEVVNASQIFKTYPNYPNPATEVKVVIADARRYINSSALSFDVIVSDLFHPARSGAASLYTREHFEKINDKLNEGGVFCQWLALHQMDIQTVQTIVASYLMVFPDAKAVLASNSLDSPVIGLISRKNVNFPMVSEMNKNWLDPTKASSALKAKLEDPYAVWGSVLGDSKTLHEFSKNVAPNTDDFLQVSYKAPKVTYSPSDTPRSRLKQLVSVWENQPNREESDAIQSGLQAYWNARKKYLEIGLGVQDNLDPLLILSNYQDQLFQLIQASPEFRPAHDTLNSLATALKVSNPDISSNVINKLQKLSAGKHANDRLVAP